MGPDERANPRGALDLDRCRQRRRSCLLAQLDGGRCRVSQSGPSTVRPGWIFLRLLGRPPTGSDQLHQRVGRRRGRRRSRLHAEPGLVIGDPARAEKRCSSPVIVSRYTANNPTAAGSWPAMPTRCPRWRSWGRETRTAPNQPSNLTSAAFRCSKFPMHIPVRDGNPNRTGWHRPTADVAAKEQAALDLPAQTYSARTPSRGRPQRSLYRQVSLYGGQRGFQRSQQQSRIDAHPQHAKTLL